MRCLNFKKMVGASMVGIGAFAFVGMCWAAVGTGRTMHGRMTGGTTTARMPSMPTLPGMSIGNTTQNTPSTPSTPDVPDVPDTPTYVCPDGGVRDSAYTVDNCMDDVLRCVNGGVVPGGLNDLFEADVRTAIENSADVCVAQINNCIADVRRDCDYVYDSVSDVWADFNSRWIQPEYYRFVLRKTGLTPYQAETACRMLDKNGADGDGKYARWDASTATCYVRVAAYNKDEQIKNSWLFGAVGNDKLAEVWLPVDETFTCNKDLFGFSLMNDTNTAAVVGIGGGTLLGAGIGAAVGHGAQNFDCKNDAHREVLATELGNVDGAIGVLNDTVLQGGERLSVTNPVLSVAQCNKIDELYGKYKPLQGRVVVTQDTTYIIKETINNNGQVIEFTKEIVVEDDSNVTETELKAMAYVFVPDVVDVLDGVDGNRLKTTVVGAATGAGVGGLATAITAFVEKNNINCRVGDNLETVMHGKSYSIGGLRDFYISSSLQLPDMITPDSNVTDCQSWRDMCAAYTDMNMCSLAVFNYKPIDDLKIFSIPSACVVSDGVCVENRAVAKSYGVCK